jgi:hypothetical protein
MVELHDMQLELPWLVIFFWLRLWSAPAILPRLMFLSLASFGALC